MVVIIIARIFQGVGAGGVFALVYIILADVSRPHERGKTLSLASAIWGVASVLGPSLGGLHRDLLELAMDLFHQYSPGSGLAMGHQGLSGGNAVSTSPAKIDLAGAAVLTTAILAFLFIFLLAGRTYAWGSGPIIGLLMLSIVAAVAFGFIEKRAADPSSP